MRYLRNLAAIAVIPVVLAGCATTDSGRGSWSACTVGGAVAGAAAGVATGGEVAGGVFGAATGAVLGGVFCGEQQAAAAMGPVDSDGDGVTDDADRCPGTRKGIPVDGNGCPVDSDGDGVPTHLDICPGTPAGVKVDSNGCPLDDDGDGVINELDKCPGTPRGEKVDAKGCTLAGGTLAIVTNINFDFDSAALRPDSKQKLASVVKLLKENPKIRVRIVGHTDSTGSEEYNLGLSIRRANAVRKYLVSQGISITRLSAIGKGESQPLVSNRTRAGRAVNRRVEFEVVNR